MLELFALGIVIASAGSVAVAFQRPSAPTRHAPSPLAPFMPKILCGECSGHEDVPTLTRQTPRGVCDGCGGTNYVVATAACAGFDASPAVN